MGKDKDKGSAGVPTTVAIAGGVFVLRKLLAFAWTKITGKVPPTDLTDPKISLVEALAWSIATGIVIETARYYIVHATMRKPSAQAGVEES